MERMAVCSAFAISPIKSRSTEEGSAMELTMNLTERSLSRRPAPFTPGTRDLDPAYFRVAVAGMMPFVEANLHLAGGEACLHPMFPEFVELFLERPGTLSLRTDALQFENYHRLLRGLGHRLQRVEVLLQGLGAEHDEALVHPGAFERLEEALPYLATFQVPLWTVSRIDGRDLPALEDWIRWSRDLGVTCNYFDAAVDGEGRSRLDEKSRRKAIVRIEDIRSRTGFSSINYGYGLGSPGGIDFCPHLRGYDPLVGADASISYCSWGPLRGECFSVAQLGCGEDEGLSRGLKAVVDRTAGLKELRIDRYERNTFHEGFDLCEFCRKACGTFASRAGEA